jgi:hypothetical protein
MVRTTIVVVDVTVEWATDRGFVGGIRHDHADVDVVSINAMNLVLNESFARVELGPCLSIHKILEHVR